MYRNRQRKRLERYEKSSETEPFQRIFGRSGEAQTRGLRIPNAARYQLRYTPIVIKLWSCKWSNLWSNTFLTAIFCFPYRPKSARLKGFRRFSLSCGVNIVYAPKAGALPTALHPDFILIFSFCRFFCFLRNVRCASLKNIVVLLAWSASHYSLFFHLRASPVSSPGRGEPLRPTALHPDFILIFSFCRFFCFAA